MRVFQVFASFLIAFLFSGQSVYAKKVNLGSGSYVDELSDLPNGRFVGGTASGAPATPMVADDFAKPAMTHDWWNSMMWDYFGNPFCISMFAHPFAYRCNADGVKISYPTDVHVFTGDLTLPNNIFRYEHSQDLIVGLKGVSFTETVVKDYSDWDVLGQWNAGNNKLYARLGHGFTYSYFYRDGNADASVKLETAGTEFYNDGNAVGVTVNDHHYGLFAPTGVQWDKAENEYTAAIDNKNYWSVAVLPDDSDETIEEFKKYAYSFITDTKVEFDWNPATGIITTDFIFEYDIKEGDNEGTFAALYPHQWKYSPSVNTDYEYQSSRGMMKTVEGLSFKTEMRYSGSLPELPLTDGLDQTQAKKLINEFAALSDAQLAQWGAGTSNGQYTWGRFLMQSAQAALVADALGEEDAKDRLVQWVRENLEDWLTYESGETQRFIYYDETWNTSTIWGEGLANPWLEHFTDRDINDHHFQVGYYLRAAAVLEQLDDGWATKKGWDKIVRHIIDDVANTDRNSDTYPFMRNFDVYAGHSWAQGTAGYDNEGADQESSSEAMNFSGALLYYATVINDSELIEKGLWMYTTEYTGVEQYWFNINRDLYPEEYHSPYFSAIVRGSGNYYQTYFGSRAEFTLGINVLPWSGTSLYLGRHPSKVDELYQWIEAKVKSEGAGNDGIELWGMYLWPYQALANPKDAIADYEALPVKDTFGNAGYIGEMESEPHIYWWMHNLDELGYLDTNITANQPMFAVFDNGDEKSYSVFVSPNDVDKKVCFSNGLEFMAEAGKVSVFKEGNATSDACNVAVSSSSEIDGSSSSEPDESSSSKGDISSSEEVGESSSSVDDLTLVLNSFNPASIVIEENHLYIDVDGAQVYIVQVIDLQGNLILNRYLSSSFKWNFQSREPGIYLLHLQNMSTGKVVTKSFVNY